MPKTIYLANPYGFSAQQKAELLPPLVSALEELGLEVWEPFERNNQIDFAEAGWAYRIGQADFRDVAESDAEKRHAASMSVRAKSPPLKRRGSRVASASA